MTSEISNKKAEITAAGENPKIVVRNAKLGLTRRARKSELKWFADRGFKPVEEKNTTDLTDGTDKAK